MADAIKQPSLEQIKAALQKDPKRSGVLGVLVLVLVIVVVRAVHTGPAPATAMPSGVALPAPVMTPGVNPETQTASDNALAAWLAQPRTGPARNMFNMPAAIYGAPPRGLTAGFSDQPVNPAKSDSPSADQKTASLAESIHAQAARYQLQSTMMGRNPMAVVNGVMVREGDTLDSFRVIRIEPRRVILQQSGVTTPISMD